jgi:hypothetical protein
MWKNTTVNSLEVASRLSFNVSMEGEVGSNNSRIHLGEKERSSDGRRL